MPLTLNIPTSIADLRAAVAHMRASIGTEYQAASDGIHAELHKFLDFVDMKAQRLESAKTLLEENGFDVTVHVAPQPAAT